MDDVSLCFGCLRQKNNYAVKKKLVSLHLKGNPSRNSKDLKNLHLSVTLIYSDRNWMWFCIRIFQEKEFLHFWERRREPKIAQTPGVCQGQVHVYYGTEKKAANLSKARGKMRRAEETLKSHCPTGKKRMIILIAWNCPNYYYPKIQVYL